MCAPSQSQPLVPQGHAAHPLSVPLHPARCSSYESFAGGEVVRTQESLLQQYIIKKTSELFFFQLYTVPRLRGVNLLQKLL